jgi:hypothetical protein
MSNINIPFDNTIHKNNNNIVDSDTYLQSSEIPSDDSDKFTEQLSSMLDKTYDAKNIVKNNNNIENKLNNDAINNDEKTDDSELLSYINKCNVNNAPENTLRPTYAKNSESITPDSELAEIKSYIKGVNNDIWKILECLKTFELDINNIKHYISNQTEINNKITNMEQSLNKQNTEKSTIIVDEQVNSYIDMKNNLNMDCLLETIETKFKKLNDDVNKVKTLNNKSLIKLLKSNK